MYIQEKLLNYKATKCKLVLSEQYATDCNVLFNSAIAKEK
jgi:hypothetical protein